MTSLHHALASLSLCVPLLAWATVGWAQDGSPAPEVRRIRIALLPMVVHSSESPDYLRSGLMDMISSRMDRIADLEVVRIDEPEAATTQLARALKTGRKKEAEFVLFGSFTRFGTGASLDVQCAATQKFSGRDPLREIFVHSGSIGDVIPDLDDLVGKVARFVVADYQEAAASGKAPALPSTQAINDLRRRIEAIEATLERLVPSPDLAAGASPDTQPGKSN